MALAQCILSQFFSVYRWKLVFKGFIMYVVVVIIIIIIISVYHCP